MVVPLAPEGRAVAHPQAAAVALDKPVSALAALDAHAAALGVLYLDLAPAWRCGVAHAAYAPVEPSLAVPHTGQVAHAHGLAHR